MRHHPDVCLRIRQTPAAGKTQKPRSQFYVSLSAIALAAVPYAGKILQHNARNPTADDAGSEIRAMLSQLLEIYDVKTLVAHLNGPANSTEPGHLQARNDERARHV